MERKLIYYNQGRGGSVVYRDDVSELRFDFEFGGGNCVAIIFVPNEEQWEKQTGRLITERAAILRFVATRALHDQVSKGYFNIGDSSIELFSN